MRPHRRPQAVSRGPRNTPSSGSMVAGLLRRAGAAVLLLGVASLAAPAPADAATANRQAATARPAKVTPTRTTSVRAAPVRVSSGGTRPSHHAARRPRRDRNADTAAYDDRSAAPTATPAVHGPVLSETGGSPRAACLAAARLAERTHGLPEGLMVAVALSESGLHAHALNIRGRAHFPEDRATARSLVASAGGRGFAGCVQISLGHARGSDWPLDPVRATDWAGALMARAYAETGSWTAAIARFHGGSPRGSQRVICRVRAKLEAAAPGSPVLRDASCGGDSARERRNGASLLEIAEAR